MNHIANVMETPNVLSVSIGIAAYLFVAWLLASVLILCGWNDVSETALPTDSPVAGFMGCIWPLSLAWFALMFILRLAFLTLNPAKAIRRVARYHHCNHCGENRNIGGWCSRCGEKIEPAN